ncbi:hypothetical protein TI04_00180, partial [Achromatium sp. WMS2]
MILLIAGSIPQQNFILNFAMWWIGDATGVFIFTPLTLVWLLRSHVAWQGRQFTVSAPLIVVLSITIIMTASSLAWERKDLRLRLEQHITILRSQIEHSLYSHVVEA